MRTKGTWGLPRLGRRGKVIRNFILSAVLLILVWVALGSPLPPPLAFRRLELRYLREPSQIVAQVEQDGETYVVGFGEQEAVLGDLEGDSLSFWNFKGNVIKCLLGSARIDERYMLKGNRSICWPLRRCLTWLGKRLFL